ncbi:cardiolipin synthase [Carnobacterium divergens]|uniref:cardiolipin synthase n=1 Tax=Carnobacterium divergens TaxID=2748 RepID=UPI0007F4698C|nr:cardiolipin synthase [Carnobacterium divergens]MPQ22506.1 cardiolipin synthase [Carnobacterium divergens]SBO16531.1 Cardiolipin synthase 1 [Carnobacterium divergens]
MKKTIQLCVIAGLIALVGYYLIILSSSLFISAGLITELIGIYIALRLLLVDSRSTNSKVAWIAIIFILPIFGVICYFFFGRNPQNRLFTTAQKKEREKLIQRIHHLSDQLEELVVPKTSQRIESLTGIKALNGNRLTLLTDGDETFSAIKKAIKQAKHHIHIQYYIYKSDELGTELRDLLIQKAREGVEVRFLYDGFGSKKLNTAFLTPMKQAGIEFYAYDPIFSIWISRTANLRNHRKIIVIDGQIGFTGGLNVGNEYLGKVDRFKFWRDTHLMIEGNSVIELQEAFLYDWVYMENRKEAANPFIKAEGIQHYFQPKAVGNEWVQVVYGGPYDQEKLVRDAMLDMIDSADESVWITSPYLVPDDESLAVLRRTAMSGIDVKILLPGKADMALSFHGSNAYIETLLEAGAEVYSYRDDSFIHGKMLLIDGKRGAIGTANFDIRSFRLNHEMMSFIYETSPALDKMKANYIEDIENSYLNNLEAMKQRSLIQKLKEQLASLFTPIL